MDADVSLFAMLQCIIRLLKNFHVVWKAPSALSADEWMKYCFCWALGVIQMAE